MLLEKWQNKFLKQVKKLLSAIHDKPLAPVTDRERRLIEELRDAFGELAVPETISCTSSQRQWFNNVNRLRELVLREDPREFLRWHVISSTMFAKHASYVEAELNFLKSQPDWRNRWSKLIKESPVGHPTPYWRYPRSSGNLIHHAYHLAKFEEKTGIKADTFDSVFEFGGGYGSMCRLFYNAGFSGRYVIFDLPAFSALQEFFLKSAGIKGCSVEQLKKEILRCNCVSDIDQLREIVRNDFNTDNSLFVATWSISEAPVSLRDMILPLTSSFKAFLIAYQHRFQEIDNANYFRNWQDTHRKIEWHEWEIEHMPANRYLVGRQKTV